MMESISLIATETIVYILLAAQVLAIGLLVLILLLVSSFSDHFVGLIGLPGKVVKAVREQLNLESEIESVRRRLEGIETSSRRASENVTKLDEKLKVRADFEDKVAVAQTVFGTVVGLAGGVAVDDWVIHGTAPHSEALRIVILLFLGVFFAGFVPLKIFPWLYKRHSKRQKIGVSP